MGDRYLFKAKRVDCRKFPEKEQWITGYYVLGFDVYEQPVHLIFEPISMFYSHGETDGWTEIDPSTICQCTGLKDENGKLIWENDIVKFQFDNEDCPFPNKDTKKRKGKVFFSDYRASFSIAMGRRGSKSLNNDLFKYVQCGNRVEVIGNIFDDPELIKEI